MRFILRVARDVHLPCLFVCRGGGLRGGRRRAAYGGSGGRGRSTGDGVASGALRPGAAVAGGPSPLLFAWRPVSSSHPRVASRRPFASLGAASALLLGRCRPPPNPLTSGDQAATHRFVARRPCRRRDGGGRRRFLVRGPTKRQVRPFEAALDTRPVRSELRKRVSYPQLADFCCVSGVPDITYKEIIGSFSQILADWSTTQRSQRLGRAS